MRWAMLALVACGETTAAPRRDPTVALVPAPELCVTKGAIADRAITEPTVRAVSTSSHGDAAALSFTFGGAAATSRALANGQERRQLGLKLRAQDGCNVIYVMWRLDPTPKLDISVKRNPGKRTHAECGADGYVKVRAVHKSPVPALAEGSSHTLRAEIVGASLYAWIDGALAWQGTLPDEAAELSGPAGLRTDNIAVTRLELSVPKDTPGACKRGAATEE